MREDDERTGALVHAIIGDLIKQVYHQGGKVELNALHITINYASGGGASVTVNGEKK